MTTRRPSTLPAALAAALLAACGDTAIRDSDRLDAGVTTVPDAGTEFAEPFVAPPREWTWLDVAGSKCANGAPTGVGVYLEPTSPDVLVFLQGGGGCWDGATCWGVGTSFYVATGYGRVEWATDVQRPLMLPLRMDDANNPFRGANVVYVPYCTGDIHIGDAVVDHDLLGRKKKTFHHGYRNLGLALDRLAATMPHIRRLWLAGDSAGGFGAALNMDRTQRRFPDARVDVLDDSGQPIRPTAGRWELMRTAWNAQLPGDCPACVTDISGMVGYLRRKYPHNRFGLISFEADAVITTFMGLFATTFYDELLALAAEMDALWPSAHYYLLFGTSHVALATPTPGLVEWLAKFASDDPGWASRKP